MICEHVRDIKQKYNDYKAGKSGEDLDRAKAEWLQSHMPKWMVSLEKCLTSKILKYSVGDRISLADVIIQQFIQDYFEDKRSAAAAIGGCPKIIAIVDSVAEAAHNWFMNRPKTIF